MGIYSPYSYHLLAKRHNEVRLYTYGVEEGKTISLKSPNY